MSLVIPLRYYVYVRKLKNISRFEYEILSELAEGGPMTVRDLFLIYDKPTLRRIHRQLVGK